MAGTTRGVSGGDHSAGDGAKGDTSERAAWLATGRARGIEEAAVVIGRARDEFEQRGQHRDATVCRMLKGEVTALTRCGWGEFTTGKHEIALLRDALVLAEERLLCAERELAALRAQATAALE
jgi:hypothetical protein